MEKDIVFLRQKLGEGCKAAPRSPGRPDDVFGPSRKCLQRAQQLLAGEAWEAPQLHEAEKGDSSEWPYLNLNVGPGRARPEMTAYFAELTRGRI